jgi:hypothetical protein
MLRQLHDRARRVRVTLRIYAAEHWVADISYMKTLMVSAATNFTHVDARVP